MNMGNTSTLQPMEFGEILDTTFRLYRKHFLLFLSILVLEFFGGSVAYLLGRFLPDFFLKDLLTDLVGTSFALVSMGGIIVVTATIYLSGRITSRDALKQAGHRFWHIFACQLPWSFVFEIRRIGLVLLMTFVVRTESTQILFTSMLVVSALFSIHTPVRLESISVPLVSVIYIRGGLQWAQFISLALAPFSVYVTVRWMFITTALLLEEVPIRRAFERSSELSRGRWWQVLGMLISFSVLSFAMQRIIEMTVGFILALTKLVGAVSPIDIIRWMVIYTPIDVDPLFSTIMMWTGFVVRTLVFPIWVIGITLLYFNLRIRKEGFDIEVLANSTTN